MIRCLSCGAETDNGLALCAMCHRAVSTNLEFTAIYYRNLARWRPGRAGSRPVPGSREPAGAFPGPSDDRIGRALDETGAELVGHMAQLIDDRPFVAMPQFDDEAGQAVAICESLAEHLTTMSTLDWVGDFVASMRRIEGRLRGLTEAYIPGWYAGACRTCTLPTYVVPGLTWVTCGGCGSTTYARDHLDIVIDEARDWVARPKAVAEALVALLDSEPSVPRLHDRIRKWESLGWLTAIRRLDADGDPIGPKRYRLGDVLDRLRHDHTPAEKVVTSL